MFLSQLGSKIGFFHTVFSMFFCVFWRIRPHFGHFSLQLRSLPGSDSRRKPRSSPSRLWRHPLGIVDLVRSWRRHPRGGQGRQRPCPAALPPRGAGARGRETSGFQWPVASKEIQLNCLWKVERCQKKILNILEFGAKTKSLTFRLLVYFGIRWPY